MALTKLWYLKIIHDGVYREALREKLYAETISCLTVLSCNRGYAVVMCVVCVGQFELHYGGRYLPELRMPIAKFAVCAPLRLHTKTHNL